MPKILKKKEEVWRGCKAVLGVDVTQLAINTVAECSLCPLFFTLGHLWALVA